LAWHIAESDLMAYGSLQNLALEGGGGWCNVNFFTHLSSFVVTPRDFYFK
jgi:hypothetical protein